LQCASLFGPHFWIGARSVAFVHAQNKQINLLITIILDFFLADERVASSALGAGHNKAAKPPISPKQGA
jgi:hypothetical protein